MRAIVIGLCIVALAMAQQPKRRLDRKAVERLENVAERLERPIKKTEIKRDDDPLRLQERFLAVREKLLKLATDKTRSIEDRDKAAEALLNVESQRLLVTKER